MNIVNANDENFAANLAHVIDSKENKPITYTDKDGNIVEFNFTDGLIIILGNKETQTKIFEEIKNMKYVDDKNGYCYVDIQSNGVFIKTKKSDIGNYRTFVKQTKSELSYKKDLSSCFFWNIVEFSDFLDKTDSARTGNDIVAVNKKNRLNYYFLSEELTKIKPKYHDIFTEKREQNERLIDIAKYTSYYNSESEGFARILKTIIIDASNIIKKENYSTVDNIINHFDPISVDQLNINFNNRQNFTIIFNRGADINHDKKRINMKKEENKFLSVVCGHLQNERDLPEKDKIQENRIIPVYTYINDFTKHELRKDVCSYCDRLMYEIVFYIQMFNTHNEAVYQPVCMNCTSMANVDYYIYSYDRMKRTLEETKLLAKINGYPEDKISYIEDIRENMFTKFRFLNKNYVFANKDSNVKSKTEGDIYSILHKCFDDTETDIKEIERVSETFEFESVDVDDPFSESYDVTVPYELPEGRKKKFYLASLKFIFINAINDPTYIDKLNSKYEKILFGNYCNPGDMISGA